MPRSALSPARPRARNSTAVSSIRSHPYATGLAALAVALAASAVANAILARRAERRHPPLGRFLDVNGVRLHYIERGQGPTLVLLHGNGSMIQDFISSGLFDMAAENYRVIAFDRPGFGHSDRPRRGTWGPGEQADLIHAALVRLGVDRATVLGHSWGCLVAVALARKHPDLVGGLVLASGYYYPTVRADAIAASPPAIPIVGDVIRYTISPILSRLAWPRLVRKIFAPAPVPRKFRAFPKEMAVRPSQIRAAAAESALLIPTAIAARGGYAGLKMPVVIVAGAGDRLIDPNDQSARLHEEILHSTFIPVPRAGHMVHQTAPRRVMAAVDQAAAPRADGPRALTGATPA